MSADPGDFSSDLRLELPRRAPARPAKPIAREVRPGGLRATGWVYTLGLEEEKQCTVEEDPPPQIVTLIALWEFCRMLLLAPIFGAILIHHHGQWNAWYFWRIYFVASNGGYSISWMTAVSFFYSLTMGILIWNCVKWSRWVLVGTSLYSALLLGRFLYLFSDYLPSLGNAAAAGLSFLQGSAWVLIVLDVIIATGLAFAPGVADAFNQEKPIQPSAPPVKGIATAAQPQVVVAKR
ncbi:MAG TPA: hypothetical protein VKT75_13630 [Acidobacteriaceae bacterium]|nr:hypothetical protein [Acidobacteriaceae bacterium]